MTNKEITKQFLTLLSKGWDDPVAHQGFRDLRKLVPQKGLWRQIIDARLMALDKKTPESVAQLKDIVARKPLNFCAALLLGSVLYRDNEQAKEAISIYDSLLDWGFPEQAEADWLLALTLMNKGVAFAKIGKSQDEIHAYDLVIERFGDSTDLPLRELTAKALVNKGVALGEIGKSQDQIDAFDKVVEYLGASSDLHLRKSVALALVYKGVALGEMGKSEDVIRVYDEVIKRFGDSTELPLREQTVTALLYKAGCFLDDAPDQALDLFIGVEKEHLGDAAGYYDYIKSRFVSKGLIDEKTDEIKTETPELKAYLDEVLDKIDEKKQEEYFKKMEDTKKRTDGFIRDDSRFSSDSSFLLVLREWNSYTPTIPQEEESDRGGGYFIWHGGEGIVIDPGYDFIENFYRAGGLLCDIDHIIVTHAHDDHTAQFEALLMLLHRRWKEVTNKKLVSLYLSAGVQRKFSGFLDLRDSKYNRVTTLCPAEKEFVGSEQRIRLNAATVLTVLPTYHEDVITQNSAIGLGFEFATKSGARKVVFTSDTGLFPPKLDADGNKILYFSKEENEHIPIMHVDEGLALHERYPYGFREPDLLIAHIGSIKEREFNPGKVVQLEDQGRWYYDNHLGILGTLTMLHKLRPKSAVISEFGSELKGFHFELVEKLRDALHGIQKREKSAPSFVIPGDLTIAYDIENQRFLCHETCEFTDPADLCFRKASAFKPKWNAITKRYDPELKDNTHRAYLFPKSSPEDDEAQDSRCAQEYCTKSFRCELPYHKKQKS